MNILGRLSVSMPFVAALASSTLAQTRDSATHVTWGGFVDTYYAWDFGRPPTRDRSFAGGTLLGTQPARHNEFNVNLAFVEAHVTGSSVRGRLALQAGTSVQANAAGEPGVGTVSGPGLARHLQEAVAGVRVAREVWIDAGVFFSHLGMESWISRDNPTYTRSLVSDYSPFYESGVRATWTPRPWLSAQLNVVNGWQNISENNDGKGAGVRLDWTPNARLAVSGYNLFSEEGNSKLRSLHGIGVKVTTGSFTGLVEADLGMQEGSNSLGKTAHWYGLVAIGRVRIAQRFALAVRAEHFDDDEQIVLVTSSAAAANPPFRGSGASMGFDVSLAPAVWRTEMRRLWNSAGVFPDGSGAVPTQANTVAVTSLALTF